MRRERALGLIRDQPDQPGNEVAGAAGTLASLCGAVTLELGLIGATVTLRPLLDSHTVAAASGEAIVGVEELQFDAGEGPTRDAYASSRPVIAGNLRSHIARWPGYAPAALEAGVGSVCSFPLHVGAAQLGALSLYSQDPRHLAGEDLAVGLGYAELATEVLIDASGAGTWGGPDRATNAAMDTHAHIYQAQGMVMVDLAVRLPEALARMRAHAYAAGQPLTVLAAEIIAGETTLATNTH